MCKYIAIGILWSALASLPIVPKADPFKEPSFKNAPQLKEGYTYLRSTAEEKELDPHHLNVTIGTWNLCGTHLSQIYGGVTHWQYRLPGIIQTICKEDPDVLVLQEIYDAEVSNALIQCLQDRYAHLFSHLGPNPQGYEGGCMVFSKYPLFRFENRSFANNQPILNRGFAALEIKAKSKDTSPCLRIIGTHIMYGYSADDIQKRTEQVEQIREYIDSLDPCPTLIAADFNIEREDPILSFLEHGYQGKEPTCMTTTLIKHWDKTAEGPAAEWIDNISLVNGSQGQIKAHLVPAFDSTSPDATTALSDHHLLIGTYSLTQLPMRHKRVILWVVLNM